MLNDEQVDSLCDEFENAWISSTPPDLVAFIQRYEDDATMRQVIEALVPLDLEYRRKTGALQSLSDLGLQEGEVAKLGDPSLIDFFRQTANESYSSSKVKFIGPYKLLQLLGKGGMGEVWMAEQERPVRRRVALKLIKTGIDSQSVVARFEAERQAIALMDHPNIAKFLDAGTTEDGQPYFVMELVKGISLTQFCDEQKLSVEHRLELLLPVCHAVQHAHQKGIIHRDLKPSNVLVALYDGRPVPKVIDFGLAKALQNERKLTEKTLFTEFGQVLGTVQYMAPEQAELNQLDVDTRIDIYSLGVILYELLTGSTPIELESFQNQALVQVLEMIREKEPPRPSVRLGSATQKAASGISVQRQIELSNLKSILQGELDWIVMKAIDKNRARRYETAMGLAEDLTHYLKNEVVTARPPSRAYLLSKFLAKHRRLVATGASLLAILTMGLCGTGVMWYRALLSDAESTRLAVREREAAEKALESEKEAKRQKNLADERLALASSAFFENGIGEYERGRYDSANNSLLQAWQLRRDDDPLKKSYASILVNRMTRGGGLLLDIEHERSSMLAPLSNENFYSLKSKQWIRDPASSVAFCPDGSCFATTAADNTVRIWDSETGAELGNPLLHDDYVDYVVFSPNGAQIATASADFSVQLWDVETRALSCKPIPHEGRIILIKFSSDGTVIGTASSENAPRIWDSKNGSPLGPSIGHVGLGPQTDNQGNFRTHLNAIDFSPDCKQVAIASKNSVEIWETKLGTMLSDSLRHKDLVTAIKFSPNSKLLATTSLDRTTRIWDAEKEIEVVEPMHHEYAIHHVEFNPDGHGIATVGDFGLEIWDLSKEKPRSADALNFNNDVTSIAFSPDGNTIAVTSLDGLLYIWDWRHGRSGGYSGKRIDIARPSVGVEFFDGKRIVYRPNDRVVTAAFSPDGSRVITSSQGSARTQVWEAMSCSPIRDHIASSVRSLAFCNSNNRLAIFEDWEGLFPYSISTYDMEGTSPHHEIEVSTESQLVRLNPNGETFTVSTLDKLEVFDVESGAKIGVPIQHSSNRWVSVIPINDFVATVSEDNTVYVWDPLHGTQLRSPMQHSDDINSIAISRDSIRLAVATESVTHLWNLKQGLNPVRELKLEIGAVYAVAFSGSGGLVATASQNNIVKLWETSSGRELRQLKLDYDGVYRIAFRRDDSCIATWSRSRGLQLWDVQTGASLESMPGYVREAALNYEDSLLATVDGIGFVNIWDVSQFTTVNIDGMIEHFVNGKDQKTQKHKRFISDYRDFWIEKVLRFRGSVARKAIRTKNWFAAELHLPWLCRQQPIGAKWHSMLVQTYAEQGKWGEATAYSKLALELYPNTANYDAHFLINLAREDKSNCESAFTSYLSLVEESDCPSHWAALIWSSTFADSIDLPWDRILALSKKVLAASPNEADYHESLGGVLYRLRQYEAAEDAFVKSLALRQTLSDSTASIDDSNSPENSATDSNPDPANVSTLGRDDLAVIQSELQDTASSTLPSNGTYYTHAFLALIYHRTNSSNKAIEHRGIVDRMESETFKFDWKERLLRKRLHNEVKRTLLK